MQARSKEAEMKKLYTENFWSDNVDNPGIHYLTLKRDNETMKFHIQLLKARQNDPEIVHNVTQPTKYIIDKIVDEIHPYQTIDLDQIIKDSDVESLAVNISRAANEISRTSRRDAGNIVYYNTANEKIMGVVERKFDGSMIQEIEEEQEQVELSLKLSVGMNCKFVKNPWVPKDKIIVEYCGMSSDSPFIWVSETDMFVHPNWKNYVAVLNLDGHEVRKQK